MNKHLTKLPRGSLRTWAIGHLQTKQGGKCLLCGKPISLEIKGNKSDYVVDHDHETGEIRGVLHRSCNAAEGKVVNAAGSWGCKSKKYADVIPYLKAMVAYLESSQENGTGLMYPDHKTPEQRAERARVKSNNAAALRRAKIKLAKEKQVDKTE